MANCNAMVVGGLFGIARIEINEGRNVFALAQRIHGHGIVGRIQEQRSGLQAVQESAVAKEGFAYAEKCEGHKQMEPHNCWFSAVLRFRMDINTVLEEFHIWIITTLPSSGQAPEASIRPGN
jgi:hypothetical protein